jgi:hypothetical protein
MIKNKSKLIILGVIALTIGSFIVAYFNYNSGGDYDSSDYHEDYDYDLVKPEPKIIYVSPEGNGLKDGSNLKNSLAGLQEALNIVKPGEIIKLAQGDYFEDVKTKTHGEKTKPITIRGPTEAILRGTDENERVVQILHDYYILDGFTINGYDNRDKDKDDIEAYRDKLLYINGTKEAYNGQIKRGPLGIEVKNMDFLNAGGECIRLRYFVQKANIHHNNIQKCGRYDFKFDENGKNGEGIYIGTSSEQWDDGKNPTEDPDESSNNHIHHNQIDTNGNECVEAKEGSQKNLIEYNICTGSRDKEAAGMTSRGNHNIFRYNTIFGNKGCGLRFGGHKEDGEKYGIQNDAYGNTIYNNDYCGLKFMRKNQGKICENIFKGPNDQHQENKTRGEYGEDYEDEVDGKCD